MLDFVPLKGFSAQHFGLIFVKGSSVRDHSEDYLVCTAVQHLLFSSTFSLSVI